MFIKGAKTMAKCFLKFCKLDLRLTPNIRDCTLVEDIIALNICMKLSESVNK